MNEVQSQVVDFIIANQADTETVFEYCQSQGIDWNEVSDVILSTYELMGEC